MEKPKIAVVGARGRLGSAIVRYLGEEGFPVVGIRRDDLCLTDPSLDAKLRKHDFDILINSAAQTNVDACETAREEAFAVNAEAPRQMAEHCKARGARFFHVSTDYVYDGSDDVARTEDSPAEPKSVYGESKLAGDEAVLAVSPDFFVLRTSWVFGPDRPSFLDNALGWARDTDNAKAIGDKVSTPCYSEDFARFVPALIASDEGGILNVCNSGACTWRDYAQHAVDIAKREGVSFRTEEIGSLPLEGFPHFTAVRPRYTAMSTERLAKIAGRAPRPWQEAVEEYMLQHWIPALT